MIRSTGKIAVEIKVKGQQDTWWDDLLTKDQRNSIRDRIDSITDDLNEWTTP